MNKKYYVISDNIPYDLPTFTLMFNSKKKAKLHLKKVEHLYYNKVKVFLINIKEIK